MAETRSTNRLVLSVHHIAAIREITEHLSADVIVQDSPAFDGVSVRQEDDKPGCIWLQTTDFARWYRIDDDGSWARI